MLGSRRTAGVPMPAKSHQREEELSIMAPVIKSSVAKILFAILIAGHLVAADGFAAQTDPAVVGRWSLGPNLPFFPVHAHTLPTGKVMIWPGDAGISGNNPWQWDPASGALTQLTLPGYDAFCSGHSFLADGRLFVAGGHIQNNVGLPTASTYDPFSNSWTLLPNMSAGRWYPTVTTLSNGDVLVVSGSTSSSTGENTLPQVYQTATNTWRNLTSAQLSLGLYPRMHLAPNGKVFVSGMSGTSRYLDTTGTGSWSSVGNSSQGRDYGSSVMYDDGKVIIVGGGSPPTNSAQVIDLNAATPAWRTVGAMAFARRQLNATVLPDGKVLVTGGTSGSSFNDPNGAVYAAEMWNPASGNEQWTTMASATIPRLYHSAVVLLPDGRLLSTGGNFYPQAEIYEPPYLLTGSARPTITAAPDSVTYGQSMFIGTPDAAAVAQVTWLRLSSVTHGFNMEQRFSRLNFSQAAGGLNVVAPSNPNLSPPGYYMLFILNGNGVPSVAKIIRIDSTTALPVLTSLSPVVASAGGPAFTFSVNGGNFLSSSEVRWNGNPRPTTFVDGTRLTAAIPASDIVLAGTAQISVFTPGGGTSNSLTFSISPTSCPVGQFYAEYFNNISLTGSPIFTSCQSSINNNWGSGGPGNGVPNDNFSVRWTGVQSFNSATYRFTATADDGIRVWVDGALIIDAWRDQAPTTYQATRTLSAGEHLIKVEYYEKGGGAVAQVSWALANGALQFSSAYYSVNESGGNATISMTRSGGSTGAVGVTVSTSNGSAGAGADYTAVTQIVSFADGDNTPKTINVPIFNDGAGEGNETVNLTLSNPTGGATLGTPATAVLTIIDDENPVPVITSLSPSSVAPGASAFILTVNGSNFVPGSVVHWNGSARATSYNDAESNRLTASIPATDVAVAGTATVTVFNPAPAGGTSNATTFTVAAPSTGCPTGQFYAEYFSNISLSGSPTFTACQPTINNNWGSGGPGNGVPNDNFSVRWTGVYVFNGADYRFTATADDGIRVWLDGSLIIDAWRDQGPTTYQATRTLTAGEHLIKVEYYEKGVGAVAQMSWQAITPLAGSLQFSSATYSVNENGASAAVTVTRTGGSAGAVAVTLTTSNGSASAGSDYTAISQTVNFADGDTTSKTVNIAIQNDGDLEGNETVNLALSNPTGGATLGGPNTAFLTIVDDDTAPNPTPSLVSITPNSASAGGAAFTLTVNGSNFVSGSSVQWNGSSRTTTFVNNTQLSAAIPGSDIPFAGTAQVAVFSPAPGGGTSGPLDFTITLPPTSCPIGQYFAEYFNNISLSGSPTFTACQSSISNNWGSGGPGNGVGNDNFSVRWTGTFSFNAASYVFTARSDDGVRVWLDGGLMIDAWRDQAPTTYQATRTLTAGDHLIKVEYYEKGGGAVAEFSWNENINPLPLLTTLSPSRVTPGSPTFNLTVNGSNFVSGSQVRWNGSDRTTTFVSSTQLRASIPAEDVAAGGTAQITAFSPAPGGGASNALNLSIAPPPTSCPTGQYLAEYFNNISLSGSPTFTACETVINYNWGSGGPGNGLANDNFSVRWTGTFSFNAASYTFTARADDGIRVWLDGNSIIDAWRDQAPTTYQATRTLTAGDHAVKVEYYEKGGGAVAQVSW
jgi:hypothetical protein